MRPYLFGRGGTAFVNQLNSKTRGAGIRVCAHFEFFPNGQKIFVLSNPSDFFSKCTEGSLFFYLCAAFRVNKHFCKPIPTLKVSQRINKNPCIKSSNVVKFRSLLNYFVRNPIKKPL